MSIGLGVGDIVLVTQFAWQTYSALKTAPSEFRTLESEVQSLSISLKSLDDDDARYSILKYTNGNAQRAENFGALMKNSKAALKPLYDLIRTYPVKSSDERKDVRDWLNGARFARKNLTVQDFRNKLSMHTTSLNIFLSSLTNFSIGRLEKLIFADTAGGSKGFSALGNSGSNSGRPLISEDGLDGTWSAIGPSLVRGNLTPKDVAAKVARYRVDILNYLDFLMDGGKPYSRKELNERGKGAVTFSLPIDLDDLQMKSSKSQTRSRESQNLMSFVDQMVTFDQDGSDNGETGSSYAVAPLPNPRSSRTSFSIPPPSPKQGSPHIVTVEPASSPKSPSTGFYTYPVDMEKTPSGSRDKPRPPSLSMARTPSGGPGPGSPRSPAAMARTPSGNAVYARSPSITTLMMASSPPMSESAPMLARLSSGGGSQPRSPPFARAILATPPIIYCDISSCKRRAIPTGARYFHCGQCAKAGYDVCESCHDQGKRCPGRSSGYHGKMELRVVGMLY